ncbi:MAG: IS1634 family transposase [Spirochaetales bacterium]|nr:IS1634 family transposase [Spirochaetales bacterium]MCF7938512.1 IS1634 family transposase [Spirochaetales bacterium]
MAYVIEQRVKNHVYLYEVESYWDKEKKQSRQKRTFLGKKDPDTGEVITHDDSYAAWDYGHTALFDQVAKKIGLRKELQEAFPSVWEEIYTLALFKLIEGKPFYLCEHWLETVWLDTKPVLSSQRISEILQSLANKKNEQFQFFSSWAKRHKKNNRFIVFDITSVSSFGKDIDYLEWGYNRDRETLPQINLGVVFARPADMPLFYSLYPGSIHDVSTLSNIITELQVLSLTTTTFVLDKGFYSMANLAHMKELCHIIPLPVRTKQEHQLVQKYQDTIRSSQYAIRCNDHVLYCAAEKITIHDSEYSAYIYLDERKQADQREHLLKQILECEQFVQHKGYRKRSDFESFFQDQKPGLGQYFGLHKNGTRYELQRIPEKIDTALNRMGMFVLITNGEFSGEEVIQLYRDKDGVEKCFDSLKNNLALKRLRIHSQEALEGVLFIEFLALILYSYAQRVLRTTGLTKYMSIPEAIFELRKIKKIRFGRKKTMITEVSKHQRKILNAFETSVS